MVSFFCYANISPLWMDSGHQSKDIFPRGLWMEIRSLSISVIWEQSHCHWAVQYFPCLLRNKFHYLSLFKYRSMLGGRGQTDTPDLSLRGISWPVSGRPPGNSCVFVWFLNFILTTLPPWASDKLYMSLFRSTALVKFQQLNLTPLSSAQRKLYYVCVLSLPFPDPKSREQDFCNESFT